LKKNKKSAGALISPDKEDWSIGESSEARDLVALMQTVLWFAKQSFPTRKVVF